jgi:hypothetical protein
LCFHRFRPHPQPPTRLPPSPYGGEGQGEGEFFGHVQ